MYQSKVDSKIFAQMYTQDAENLANLSKDQPIMLVFLRHFGCVFCKEALDDIQKLKPDLAKEGVQLVFAHMSKNEVANKYFSDYKLAPVPHISDPEAHYYATFGLMKGTPSQLLGFGNWMRGFEASISGRNFPIIQKKLGDSTQMPGIFLIQNSEIKGQYIHRLVSDRPDYMNLISHCRTESH